MKILNILLILTILTTVGCKTQKIASKPSPVKTESAKPEAVKPESTVKSATTSGTVSTTGKYREERITAAKGEASDLGSKRFYIIVGSFGVYDNAQKFKKQLASEGFHPGILVNEAGFYRVCVNSFDLEDTARTKLSEVRGKYADAWLLIKKQ